ncbi:MAG: hypothetical protein FIA95_08065 [Gemmatimonadetes bacterium]|nr:hypothetical protein [Gemmatimonadota bacterium]
MRRTVLAAFGMLLLASGTLAGQATSPALFEMPFKFKVASQEFAAGEYRVHVNDEGRIVLHQVATGRETEFPTAGKLDPPAEPAEELRLVFSIVGNFAPSYTEYITEYVLTEAWLGGEDGLLIRAFKGTYKTHVVTGRKAGG